MTDRLTEKAARAVEAWLEERGLVIRPREPTERMLFAAANIVPADMCKQVWRAMLTTAPAPDTKAMAQVVIDAISGAYDD